MRFCCLAVPLFVCLALGQTAAPAPQATPAAPPAAKAAKPAAPKAEVAPDAAVITIEGVCEPSPAHPVPAGAKSAAHPAKTAGPCKTVITRAQFESLAEALQPNMNAASRKQLANFYPKLLLYSQEAHKRGLDKDPKHKQALDFRRFQALAQELVREIQEEAQKVSDAEIEKYYKDNGPAFEQVGLQRVYIANSKFHGPDDDKKTDEAKAEEMQKADQEAMKKEADAVHERAAKGEDLEKLQKEAYEMAGLQGTPPKTDIGKLTRGELPVNHRSALDLKPGEVSQIFVEGNGYYLYKVTSKEMKPLPLVREQIKTTLSQQKAQDALQAIDQSSKAELNEAYFTPPHPTTPRLPVAPPAPRSSAPSASPATGAPAATPAPTQKPEGSKPPAAAGPGDPKN